MTDGRKVIRTRFWKSHLWSCWLSWTLLSMTKLDKLFRVKEIISGSRRASNSFKIQGKKYSFVEAFMNFICCGSYPFWEKSLLGHVPFFENDFGRLFHPSFVEIIICFALLNGVNCSLAGVIIDSFSSLSDILSMSIWSDLMVQSIGNPAIKRDENYPYCKWHCEEVSWQNVNTKQSTHFFQSPI